MAAEKYIIELHNHEWKVRFKDTYYGPYNTQDEAVEAALDAAFAMGEIGIDAEVLVQDGEHPLKTEWAYPADFNTFMR